MKLAKVIGHVWATKKVDSLVGSKLMIVREEEAPKRIHVAADAAGAGIGEIVIITSGSTARRVLGNDDIAADCAIVAIVDKVDKSE